MAFWLNVTKPMGLRAPAAASFIAAALVLAGVARAGDSPLSVTGRSNGIALLQVLGPRATEALAPASGSIGALVALPKGAPAESLGLEPVVPGIGRLRGSPSSIIDFGLAHPGLRVEVAPPLHPLLNRAGQWVASTIARSVRGANGAGVMVGVADTGLDVTHPEMRDENGKSRVAWLLDLSLEPLGIHPDLEEKFGVKDATGKVAAGAVFSTDMIDELLADYDASKCIEKDGKKCAPSDEIGHGTHVMGIAASRGATGKFPGIAPAASILFVRVTRSHSEGIDNDDLVRAVQFMFDRADAEKKPVVVNLSLGSDFGPHDGTFLWEKTIADHVGSDHPGRAIVAAAGNSGSIVDTPIHQSVRVTRGATMRVPITTSGATAGSVQVWITLRRGADLAIGLDGPDGEWIAPVNEGHQNGKNTNEYNAGVVFGASDDSPVPADSRGGVVVWTGKWPSGTYSITLEGSGMADLYLQALGDAGVGSQPASFANGVREGTINLPATHPSIIGVGCTVNRPKWTSIAGVEVNLRVPILDGAGGLAVPRQTGADTPPSIRDLGEGEVCWFSSAGPTATGVPKPEISAPGALVISAMSRNAKPGTVGSVFSNPNCPTKSGAKDNRCFQIDETHAIAVGTSMSAPVVAGVVALLLQKDPTLTQDKILALLQAGAHRFRADVPFSDQSGPGEVDAMGALDALDQMANPALQIPSAAQSWLALSADYVAADGSTPFTTIVELRTADGAHRADFFDANRLTPTILVDGKPIDTLPPMVRRGPGVWFFEWTPPPGLGGSRATVGALFDGAPIVTPRTIPIATDPWNASYPSHATGGGCVVSSSSPLSPAGFGIAITIAALLLRRRHSSASVRSQACDSQISSSGSNA